MVLLCYAILLGTIMHNVARYLIGQRRFKSLHITYFYLLTTLVCIVRVTWFCIIIYVTKDCSRLSQTTK